jgi:ABC-type uncharacterized transport system permease subunit
VVTSSAADHWHAVRVPRRVIRYEAFLALVDVVTLVVLVVRGRNSRTPSALGIPFDPRVA